MSKKTVSMESLKGFVRKESTRFLKQPNVTSVGIGYKIKDGKPTKDLSIQFTVARKVAPEALEGIGATQLPKSVTVDGVEVSTDVLQRSFDKGAREVRPEVRLEATSVRKAVVNPVRPGVSVGHKNISAGTVGCVVYDADNGAPYILSNWHVLNGATGKVGDDIVQPGRHDDNRVDKNVVGKLARSHLGIAGDCAIASISDRRLDPSIVDLNVAVRRIGEPDLGDRVIKSGRTTGVTYGVVRRIHVTVKINYDEAGDHEIGCFEIGPDDDHPASDGEISMGGDSGSAWMYVDGKKSTDMMVGLHFAGEVGDEPEHALACYPGSVFEKLRIVPVAPVGVLPQAEDALGYAPNFLGTPLAPPAPANDKVRKDLIGASGQPVAHYMHFSLSLSRTRRFARWVAWNIDGGSIRKISRNGIPFKKDPNIPAEAQVGNELYVNNSLDRGHIARRADLVWGTLAEARRANIDSFFYSNITPQHEKFNQSEAGGIWGELENAIFEDVDVENLRISVMGGPIFSDKDRTYRDVRLPKEFWKIIYFKEANAGPVKAKGFVLTQADLLNRVEVLELPDFAVYEVPIAIIADKTELLLPSGIKPSRSGGRHEIEEVTDSIIRKISSVKNIV